jgi:hypothetical protein
MNCVIIAGLSADPCGNCCVLCGMNANSVALRPSMPKPADIVGSVHLPKEMPPCVLLEFEPSAGGVVVLIVELVAGHCAGAGGAGAGTDAREALELEPEPEPEPELDPTVTKVV